MVKIIEQFLKTTLLKGEPVCKTSDKLLALIELKMLPPISTKEGKHHVGYEIIHTHCKWDKEE